MVVSNNLIFAKIKAALVHGVVTLCVGLVCTFLVFNIWYPNGLADVVGGGGLLKLIIIVELCMGPLMSLVIFNPSKPRSELVRDYAVVGVFQLAALVYGLHSTFISRPVFKVFVVDRIELISAVELKKEDYLLSADKEYQRAPLWGFKTVCVDRPSDAKQRSDILLSALEGKDIELMPRYYRDCTNGEVAAAALKSDLLYEALKIKSLDEAQFNLRDLEPFTWLPIKSRFGSWVEIYPNGDLQQVVYKKINPFI